MKRIEKLIVNNWKIWVMSILFIGWTFVKDVFVTGAEVKAKTTFLTYLSSKEAKAIQYNVADSAIANAMNDPFKMIEALGSASVTAFADKKMLLVTEEYEAKMIIQDSINRSFYRRLAKETGEREDNMFSMFVDIVQKHKKDERRRHGSRVVDSGENGF